MLCFGIIIPFFCARILRAGLISVKMLPMTHSAFHPDYQKITAALVRIRKDAGLTQRELAEKLERERSFVSRVETGQRRLDLLEFVWWCRACNLSPVKEAGRVLDSLK